MGMSKSAPETPDLNTTIGSQVGGNIGLTNFNNRGTLYGTSSPYGSTSWDKVRNNAGNVKKQKYDLSNQAQISALGKANELMGSMGNFGLSDYDFTKSIGDYGGSVFDPSQSTAEVEKKLYGLGASFLDPRFEQQAATNDAALTAKGIRPGTEAYSRAMQSQGDEKTRAYNDLLLSGHGQAYNELLSGQAQQFGQAKDVWGQELAQRGQYAGEQFGTQDRNIQYLTQLLQAGRPNMPQFTGSSPQASPYNDYAGEINTNWDQQFKAWQQESANKGNMFGGAMSGLAGIIGSDERIKDNIKQVGKTQDGLPIYEFSIGDGDMQTGVMAQDVEKVNPDAVVENAGGVKGVDYPAAVGDGTGTYTVEKGDNIWEIAQRFGVEPQAIIEANPDIQNPDFIVPGQQLVVPGMAAPGPEAIPLAAMPAGGPEAVTAALTAGPGTVAPGSMPATPVADPRAAAAAPPDPSIWAGKFVQPQSVPMAPTAEGYQSQLDQAADQGQAVPPPRQLIDLEAIRQLMSTGGMGGY
jgi:LysM repeat protein